MGEPGSLREVLLIKAIDKEYELRYMENLLLINATLAATGKVDISVLNKLLQEYNEAIFGKKSSNQNKESKNTLEEKIKGFREVFGKKQIRFKAKVGGKIKKEFKNADLKDLIKMEIK